MTGLSFKSVSAGSVLDRRIRLIVCGTGGIHAQIDVIQLRQTGDGWIAGHQDVLELVVLGFGRIHRLFQNDLINTLQDELRDVQSRRAATD